MKRSYRFGKHIFSLLCVLALACVMSGLGNAAHLLGFSNVREVHAEGIDDLNPDRVDIYFLESVYAEKIGDIPAQYTSEYQIKVTGISGTPSYSILSGANYATVSEDGIVKPKEVIWYKGSGYWTTGKIEGAETKIEYKEGEAVIRVTCGDYTKDITFNVVSYSDEYVENRMNSIIDEIITDGMTEYQKLNAITTWVGNNTDYSVYYQSAKDMLIHECGDCWASTNTILAMCDRVGIKAKSRRGNQDAGAGSGHRNVIAVCDGKYYVAEAGYGGTRPRGHSVYEEPMGFSVRNNTIYQYDGDDMDVVVPSEINGKTITGFGNGTASVFVSNVNTVTLPASITTIGDKAFSGISGLSDIIIDDANESFVMSDKILYSKDKTKLILALPCAENITIAPTVKEIRYMALGGFKIDELTIPASMRTIGNYAFYNTTIGRLTIENGIETIGKYSFYGCIVDEIVLPDSVTTLEECAFNYCKANKIVLSDNITEIPAAAFNASNVDSVELPDKVTSIGKNAFKGCSKLQSVSIPKSVTSIGADAFLNSSKLTDIFYGGTEEDWEKITFDSELSSSVKVWYEGTVRVTGIEASDTDVLLTEKGETAALSATVLPDNADNKTITYTSDNTSVAKVTDNVVTAVGEGTCKVTAVTADGGYRAVFNVEVKYKRYKLNLDGGTIIRGSYMGSTSGEFLKDEWVYIQADSIEGRSFESWSYDGTLFSSNYYAQRPITQFQMPERDVDLKAVFEDVKITGLSIGGSTIIICPDEQTQLSVFVTPSNANANNVKWSTSDSSVLTVDDNGLVTAHKWGEAVVTVTATDGSNVFATKSIEVREHVTGAEAEVGASTGAGGSGDASDETDTFDDETGGGSAVKDKAPTGSEYKDDASDETDTFDDKTGGGSAVKDKAPTGSEHKDDASDETEIIELPGVGTISEDGNTLTDNLWVSYLISDSIKVKDIAKNLRIADEDTGGKYTITSVKKKNGRAVSGTVEYSGVYNERSKKITIPKTVKLAGKSFKVTSVKKNAFKNNKIITSVVIGNNITKINANAFRGCSKLKTVTIKGTGLTKIGGNAFKGISSKVVFKVPKSRLKKYKGMIKKAGAPKGSKIKK